jgi:hypothetical protein
MAVIVILISLAALMASSPVSPWASLIVWRAEPIVIV